jgi:hypothetical protein
MASRRVIGGHVLTIVPTSGQLVIHQLLLVDQPLDETEIVTTARRRRRTGHDGHSSSQ